MFMEKQKFILKYWPSTLRKKPLKFLAPIHIKTKAEFEKDRFEVENALNKFCLKYPDLIMGFSVRHNSVMHPSVIDECGLGLPIFSVKPMITGEVLDRDYKW